MPNAISPGKLQKARSKFYYFNFLNSFSFVFVSGSFLTLFAIRLGASKAIVGLLNAVAYLTFFLMPAGKKLVQKHPIVKVFGWGWVSRYIALLPVLFAPLLSAKGHNGAALGLLVAGTTGFAISRGVALIGNNPVVGFLASGGGEKPRSDRGQFIVNTSIINSLASMVSGLLIAIFLGEQASPWSYALGVGIGIVTGLAGCILLLQTPEPTNYKPETKNTLLSTTLESIKDPAFKRFILIFMVLSFASGMGRSFLPVYAKDAFHQADDAVMVYSLLASLGAVAMGLLSRLVVDRLGSKPLFIIFSALGLASFIPMAIIPSGRSVLASGTVAALFLSFIHFLSAFGFSGEENAGQTYYFSLVPRNKTLDLSVVYYIAYGMGGALGSGFGGVLLDLFDSFGLSQNNSFRLFYALLSLMLIAALSAMRKLKRLGSASVSESIGVMFSLRDLKAFDLLARLDRSETPADEIRLIHELGQSPTRLSQKELIEYLHSPRFEVRMEALLALEAMPMLGHAATQALVRELEANTYTTAYVAARILGRHRIQAAIPVLSKAAMAEDYMLQGSAMVALAKIGDINSIPLIETILQNSRNPRVKISAAYALELLNARSSLPVLASTLRHDDPPAFVSDEITLAMASILGVMKEFYPLYSAFIEDESDGIAQLKSTAQDIIVDVPTLQRWNAAVDALFSKTAPDGKQLSALILDASIDSQIDIILAEALLDPRLCYRGLRFLAASYPLFVKRI